LFVASPLVAGVGLHHRAFSRSSYLQPGSRRTARERATHDDDRPIKYAGEPTMKNVLIAAALLAGVGLSPVAQAKGCLKGAAVGGVAGHVAGKHGALGAAAGCAVGHHRANKKEQQAQQAQQAQPQQQQQQAPAQAPAAANKS
jgi:hypothetical protein